MEIIIIWMFIGVVVYSTMFALNMVLVKAYLNNCSNTLILKCVKQAFNQRPLISYVSVLVWILLWPIALLKIIWTLVDPDVVLGTVKLNCDIFADGDVDEYVRLIEIELKYFN